jgi:cardiolipin synthase (CMP-forming)
MLNLPNLLSVARILFVPLIIILLIDQRYGWALVVFIGAAVTDAVDGLLARVLHQRTVLGSYLDPAADKLLSTACFLTLAILNIIPGWLTVIVIGRDVIISLGFMIITWTSHELLIRVSVVGKLTTAFQFCLIPFSLLFLVVPPIPFFMDFLIWGTAILTLISGLQYISRGIRIMQGNDA